MTESTITEDSVSIGSQEEAPIRVLHADDEAGFLKAAKQILEMQGAFQVETASSVEEAMEILEKKSFDVIVSDYIMPAKTGLDFLKELRESGNNIPFIIFTGKGREEVAIEALNLGADHYVSKIGKPETVYYELAHGIRQVVKTRQAEEALRKSEERYRQLTESISDVFFAMDKDLRYTYWNKASEKLKGISAKDAIGKSLTEVFPDVKGTKIEQFYSDVLRTKQHQTFVSEYRVEDEDFVFEIDAYPTENGLSVFVKDITERKKMEERIAGSEEKYRRIVELAPDSIITANMQGVVTSVNTTFTRLTGFSKDEIVGKHFTKVGTIRKRDFPMFLKLFASILRGKAPKPFEVLWKNKDGATHPTEIHVTLVKSDGKTVGFQAITRDITERKKVEEALRDANEKWVSLMKNTDDVIMILDDKGTIQYLNSTPLAPNPEETIGKSVYEYVPRDQRDIMRKSLRKVFRTGKPESYEVSPNIQGIDTIWFSTKVVPVKHDRKTVSVILISTDITERKGAKEKRNKLLHDYGERIKELRCLFGLSKLVEKPNISKEEILQGTNDLLHSAWQYPDATCSRIIFENREFKTENFKETPWKQSSDIKINGKKAGAVEVYLLEEKSTIAEGPFLKEERDLIDAVAERLGRITEQKKAEEKLKMLNEKLEVVGKLTRHDIRNKLQVVTSNVYLAKQMLTDDHETMKYLGAVESACDQMEKIFGFARTYERLGMEELVYMDVEKSLNEAVMQFSDLHGAKIVNDCHGLTVLADSLLRQLLYNLIGNSLKHGEKVSQIRAHYEEVGKGKLKLVYEDDGVGIPRAEKEKIFMEGYGKGTGYGLYLIRKMCEVYGWSIKETGKQGKGAQFTITIPKMNEQGKPNYKVN